ncbi:MAG: cytidylate kinase-like family protein [Spirochaetaceae bacterium]|nr:cytidylate kinase-like family protein [Myxococcales bacterium]MCB9722938.1 cytidylate kinase-like family protein [Spirochaetaceae bacterium]
MVITISREYLAGAAAVAERIAAGLGWTVVDDAFIEAVAERSGYTPEEVRSLEESVPTFMERFAKSSALSLPEFLAAAPNAIEGPDSERLASVSRELVKEVGRRERIVMVGRAAAAVLAREHDAIHVRLVASLAHRVQIAMKVLDLDHAHARRAVVERDTNRARYHREYFDRDWSDPLNYHMVLNTELLGTDHAADLVVAHARSLGW